LIGNPEYHQAYAPLLPEIAFIRYNNHDDIGKIDTSTAAVILEAVQGEAGIRVPDLSYMHAIRKRCDETGTLLIFNEIHTGFGFISNLCTFVHYGIVPAILLLSL